MRKGATAILYGALMDNESEFTIGIPGGKIRIYCEGGLSKRTYISLVSDDDDKTGRPVLRFREAPNDTAAFMMKIKIDADPITAIEHMAAPAPDADADTGDKEWHMDEVTVNKQQIANAYEVIINRSWANADNHEALQWAWDTASRLLGFIYHSDGGKITFTVAEGHEPCTTCKGGVLDCDTCNGSGVIIPAPDADA